MLRFPAFPPLVTTLPVSELLLEELGESSTMRCNARRAIRLQVLWIIPALAVAGFLSGLAGSEFWAGRVGIGLSVLVFLWWLLFLHEVAGLL